MNRSNIVQIPKPEEKVRDVLTEVLRSGARKLLADAIEAEVSALLARHMDYCDTQGHRYVVRNGYLPEREIQTGIGPVEVKVPRVRDRSGSGITFTSGILPPYLRRTKSLEELIPWLYLKGVSTGDFTEALSSLLGKEAPGLSPSTVARLKDVWQEEHAAWEKRTLTC